MKYNAKKGWYKIINKDKFIAPLNEYMESYKVKDGNKYIEYKSSLERIAFSYADLNPKIKCFSVEPFCINYVKPLDNKVHRYFIDMYIEFINGCKFIVEIKSKSETVKPPKPKSYNPKKLNTYKQQIETYIVNQAKWKQATEFANKKGLKFIILTEEQLKL